MSRKLPDRSRAFDLLDEMGAAELEPDDREFLHSLLRASFHGIDGERLWRNVVGLKILELTKHRVISPAARRQVRALATRMSRAGPANIAAFNFMRLAGATARQAAGLRKSTAGLGKYRKGRKRGSYGPLKRELLKHWKPGRSPEQILDAFKRKTDAERTMNSITWTDDNGEHTHSVKTIRNAIAALMKAIPA